MDNHSGEESAPDNTITPGMDWSEVEKWRIQSPGEAWGAIEASDHSLVEGRVSALLKLGGAGDLVCRPPEPLPIPEGSNAAQVWVHLPVPFERDHLPELVVLFDQDKECSLGRLDFQGWHLLHKLIGHLEIHAFAGLAIRGILAREEVEFVLDGLSFCPAPSAQLDEIPVDLSKVYSAPPSMQPTTEEEIDNSIEQDGISFLFEARSLSAVVHFIYTPIEGTFSDIELEINSSDPIKPAQDGGITIEMGGREWASNDETIERHFVSCEQVGDCVEARWQWKHGEELADFLYRFRIEGKSLVVELEGGNHKATGVSLGHVEEAIHPRLICIPYFNLGPNDPHILCTSGVFVSSLLDWYKSRASTLFAPTAEDGSPALILNGGCSYAPGSDGKRNALHERWVLTVSRRFDEVLPAIPVPQQIHDPADLRELIWYPIASLEPAEETYVEVYEHLLKLKQWGMDHLLVLHPPETWHDGDGNATLTLRAAAGKGGDDALSEYLDALPDLGYKYSLYTNYKDISPINEQWNPAQVALLPDGNLAPTKSGCYLFKPTRAMAVAAAHTASIVEKYQAPVIFLGDHASTPPWDRLDCDVRLEKPASFASTFYAEQAMLKAQAQQNLVVGEGGSHWLYPGLLRGYLARQTGPDPAQKPLLVDFALRNLHPLETDAGLGSPEQFFGGEIPAEEKRGNSRYLDRYLATTVAYGHAGCLPDFAEWGLPAVVKTYYLLQKLQTYYLGSPVASINYHYNGNLLDTTEALISGAHDHSQVRIVYENGLQVCVNGGWENNWTFEHAGETITLPPASFWAHAPDGLLVYSADTGSGRIDFARCPEYYYCDTRGTQMNMGPISLDGAALVRERKWEIDVYPIDCTAPIRVQPTKFWTDRRLPRLRLLAFRPEEDEPESLNPEMTENEVIFQQTEDFYLYRITLPEWMVEPGR